MKQRRIKSISQDVVFATTSGQKKPRKHLELGLILKSLTGSRKVVEMINRLGHCVNYHTVQELETELTIEATRSNIKTPFGMNFTNNCGTGIAWDNFDRFVETQSGRDTLHDTVGIAYQVIPKCYKEQHPVENIPATDNYTQGNTPQLMEVTPTISYSSENSLSDPAEESVYIIPSSEEQTNSKKKLMPGKRRRRVFEPTGLEIQPHRKKPKKTTATFLAVTDPRRCDKTVFNFKKEESWKKDILWMVDVITDPHESKLMWVGWNSLLIPRNAQTQKIWYLPKINQSPTSNAVIVETMNRSLSIANECGKKSIAVTYDLAIAKVAMQIQAEEKPQFDNVVVALGSFHIELALFSAFGKFIAESGGTHILNECEVLANGSVKSFNTGKNYKRCKRMHELLALAMESLHFEMFLTNQESDNEIIEIYRLELNALGRLSNEETSYTYSKEIEEILQVTVHSVMTLKMANMEKRHDIGLDTST